MRSTEATAIAGGVALAVLAILPVLDSADAAPATIATVSTHKTLAVTKLSQTAAATQLTGAGISAASSGNCTTRTNPTCTSYEQINQTTVSGAITLKRASGCGLTITGGTEAGHASGTYSHWNGDKVDVRKTTCIDGYVKNTFTYIGLRGDGYPQWKAASGNLYCDEGSHWDITYFTSGS